MDSMIPMVRIGRSIRRHTKRVRSQHKKQTGEPDSFQQEQEQNKPNCNFSRRAEDIEAEGHKYRHGNYRHGII